MTQQLTITRPDDWHLHFRDGAALATVVPHTARQFGRAIVMPNLTPPVTTTSAALAYRDRILSAIPEGAEFDPLMTLYLTDHLAPEEIRLAKQSGHVVAGKLYPAGATTNSDAGVTDISKIYAVLEAMQECDMVLCVHGEVTGDEFDIFDREAIFIEQILGPLVKDFPELKIILEHITTEQAVEYVSGATDKLAATITPQHLLFSRNEIFRGGIRPHYYCLPILKRETHRRALIKAATSGNSKFFLGTDSAPHTTNTKERACGCAGCYSAFHAMELYAEAFDQADAMEKLEGFASFHGADYYGLPRNVSSITLQKTEQIVPQSFDYIDQQLTPLMAGESLQWSFID
ncbi:MAG: dihydroorotase [Parasphingorhabdus sp.]|jgi:dihydroorotase